MSIAEILGNIKHVRARINRRINNSKIYRLASLYLQDVASNKLSILLNIGLQV
jgi:hypothetical protein